MRLSSGDGNKDFSNTNLFILTRSTHHHVQIFTPQDPKNGSSKVLLCFNKGAGRPWAVDLSNMTEAELLAFRETVLIATEAARPICAELDQRAQEEQANGDDSNPRCYRQVPTVLVRPRALAEYDKRLLDGREDVLRGVQLNVVQPNGLADPGGQLDEPGEDKSSGREDRP